MSSRYSSIPAVVFCFLMIISMAGGTYYYVRDSKERAYKPMHINSVARVDTLVNVDTGYRVVRQAHHDRTMVSADEMKLMVAICKHLYRENDSLRTVIAERSQGRGY